MAPAPPVAGKHANRRKLLIYGGIAAAMLIMVILSRRQAGGTPASTQAAGATPVSNPAVDPGTFGTGGSVDNAAQLSSFESSLLNTLPATIESSISQGLAGLQLQAQTPGTAAGTGSSALADFAGVMAAVVGAQQAGVSIYQSGAAAAGPGNRAPTRTAVKPVAAAAPTAQPTSSRPDPHAGWGPHTRKAGHKLAGHSVRY